MYETKTIDGVKTLCIYGGASSSLYINGALYATAAGGSASVANRAIVAESNTTSVRKYKSDNKSYSSSGVHWHTGNGSTDYTLPGLASTLYQAASPAGCYAGAGHTCNKGGFVCTTGPCPGHHDEYSHRIVGGTTGTYDEYWTCTTCGHTGHCPEGWKCNQTIHYCNGMVNYTPTNTWTVQCGYNQGEILNTSTPTITQNAVNQNRMTSTLVASVPGKFKFQLPEQNHIQFKRVGKDSDFKEVSKLIYQGRLWNILVQDGAVAYVRHGTLN